MLILDITDESDLEDYLLDYTTQESPWFEETLKPKISPLGGKKKKKKDPSSIPEKVKIKSFNLQAAKKEKKNKGPVRSS